MLRTTRQLARPSYRTETIRQASNLSGLQKQVLSLYRKLLRTSNQKDSEAFVTSLSNSDSTTFAIKNQFRDNAIKLSKRDVPRIEYNIRRGEKYVKTLQMDGTTAMKSR
mmetsp:Transcript_16719/g.25053  ORF Transcript_16719/g.25053 Transcript_16719/m.25053 type:complete len:109 (-) Transcript_16719:369-695(-)